MSNLIYTDHRQDPPSWARKLKISREAVELYLASDVIDLHIDSFIWHRLWGYDLTKSHALGWNRGFCFGQADFPRVREAQITGAIWVITTNPLPNPRSRAERISHNLRDFKEIVGRSSDELMFVRTRGEYEEAKKSRKHAVF